MLRARTTARLVMTAKSSCVHGSLAVFMARSLARSAVDGGDHPLDQVVGDQPALGHRDEQRFQVGVAQVVGERDQRVVVGKTPVALAQRETDGGPADPYLVRDGGR